MKVLKNTILFIFVATIFLLVACNDNESRYAIPPQYKLTSKLREGLSIDSLIKISEALRADESIEFNDLYADAILTWCKCYQRNDDSTYLYASRTLSKLSALPDTSYAYRKIKADIELITGFSLIVSEPDSAIDHIGKSVHYAELIGATELVVKSHLYIGEICKNRGDYITSLQHLNTIQEICDTLPTLYSNASWIITVLADIAGLATEIGDERLVSLTIQTASFYYDNASIYSQTYYLYQRVRSHFYFDQYLLAIFNAQRLEKILQDANDYTLLSWAYVIHGLSLSRINESEDAELYRNKADSVMRQYNVAAIKEKRMLDGEIAAMNGKSTEAYHILFDSISSDHRHFEYRSLLESN